MDHALGVAIRLRRKSLGLTQAQLGAAIGVSYQQIQKYERAGNRISFSMLVRLGRALDCSVEDLLGEVERTLGRPAGPEAQVQAEAAPLIKALSIIPSPAVRHAILDLALCVARGATPG